MREGLLRRFRLAPLGLLRRLSAQLRSSFWLRPAVTSLGVILLVILLEIALRGIEAPDWLPSPSTEDLVEFLRLVATSALTVATVALSAVAVVLSMVSGQGSPRAVPELMSDPTVKNAISAFIGVLVYGFVGGLVVGRLVLSSAGASAIFILAVVAELILLRYLVHLIHHVSQMMNIERLIDRLHRGGAEALERWLERGQVASSSAEGALLGAIEGTSRLVCAEKPGYVIAIDLEPLTALCGQRPVCFQLHAYAGSYVSSVLPIGAVWALDDVVAEEAEQVLRGAVALGSQRDAATDPLLALELLSEIGARALSPGINDPITAVSCLDRIMDLLAVAGRRSPAVWPPSVQAQGRLRTAQPEFRTMLNVGLVQIIIYGSGNIAVVEHLGQSLLRLRGLADNAHRHVIEEFRAYALEHAMSALPTEGDRARGGLALKACA